MTELPQTHLGLLAWTENLPAISGPYFVWSDRSRSEIFEYIEVNDFSVSSDDDRFGKEFYELGQGYLFLGPLNIIPPTNFPAKTVVGGADDKQGNPSDV